MSLLRVENLEVTLQTSVGPARAVRDVSFQLERGQSLGIVGESGCGKSMTALALMGLLPEGATTAGRVMLGEDDLLTMPENELCGVRGNRLAMIFQEPMTSLNPLHTIGAQVMEPLLLHRGLHKSEARDEAYRLLDQVGIPNAKSRLDNYPHQLSGGQRQRVMIALALSCDPDILIADEPTTALDVTIQSQILDLIEQLVSRLGMSLILISHDLGVISESVDRVMVMYGGTVVESGPTQSLFHALAHPYTRGLFASMPRLGGKRERLTTIPGTVPDLADLPTGCTFAGRCPLVTEACRAAPPPRLPVADGHEAACIHLDLATAARPSELFS
ncbi:ABC transporter ATP-binding protein [Oceanibacterium hippocampi]|uniref:Oligopeptide transport ATP-binding protein OppD n=1 Tax=Oceanibacterium hippocampi TaxID=745714 RepID=A0A1Y5R992_9PROT|nr:ABC transporter ATP-binding protein [Oceanibacterium hippocampi]SLN12103.1 Oligopeptide transport ATP-binding protein OppD [Oceanibacterium hippocampi]